MGQWGAYGYALHGWNAEKILAHYYTGTDRRRRADPDRARAAPEADGAVTLGSAKAWSLVDGVGQEVNLPAGPLEVPASLQAPGPHARLAGDVHARQVTRSRSATTPTTAGLLVVSNGKKLQVVNIVDLESYLDGVVGVGGAADLARGRTRGAGDRRPLVRAREATDGRHRQPVQPLLRLAQPGLRRHRRRDAGGHEGGRRRPPARSSSTRGRSRRRTSRPRPAARPRRGSTARAARFPTSARCPTRTTRSRPTTTGARSSSARRRPARRSGSTRRCSTSRRRIRAPATSRARPPSARAAPSRLTGSQVQSDLGLRSTWFELGWLSLTPPGGPGTEGRDAGA